VWSARRQRTRGRKATGVASHSFVIAVQNHDQVGNRATGDRLSALVDDGRLKIAATLLLLAPFTPMLFQGEEWAASSPFLYFTDHSDQEVGNAVRVGRHREFAAFGWDRDQIPDPQAAKTFEQSRLNWNELDEPFHRRMLEWYRAVIGLRRRLPLAASLVGEGVVVEVDDELSRIEFARDAISVRVNLGEKDWQLPLPEGMRVLMASDPSMRPRGGMLCLSPSSVAILEIPNAVG
jgi:maltooligosyltrehalose trehalohydrolase